MNKLLLTTIILFLINSFTIAQNNKITCNEIVTTQTHFRLTPMQKSLQFNYQYYGPNAGVVGGLYIWQSVTLDDTSVISSIELSSEQDMLFTYIYENQTINLDINYTGSIIPRNYTVTGKYIVFLGSNGTCDQREIPFTLTFNGCNSGW